MPARPIVEVLKKHAKTLMSIPGVVGTGQGLCEGKPCIKVFVIKKTPDLEQKIPKTLDGYQVVIEEIGEVKALPLGFRALPNPEDWALGDKPLYLVVTEKNWSSYYPSQPKASDFATSIYVVASLGMKPNPGYRIRILQIQQKKDKLTVKLELGEPDPKKFYPQVLVHPIAVAEMPKANLQPYTQLNFVFTDQKGRQITTVKAEI